jgi:GABA(A) receptor-associated protein
MMRSTTAAAEAPTAAAEAPTAAAEPSAFKRGTPFADRQALADKIKARYPGRLPVICEPAPGCALVIDKCKLLVDETAVVAHLLATVRQRVGTLRNTDALFLFARGSIPASAHTVREVYDRHADPDGILYVQFDQEHVFGGAR